MPMENPDIIQLGTLIRDDTELGSTPYSSQTGLDIGDDSSPTPPPSMSAEEQMAQNKRNQISKTLLFLGVGIIIGTGVGIAIKGRRR